MHGHLNVKLRGPTVHLWAGISNLIIWRVLMKFDMSFGVSFLGVKWRGRNFDHLSPSGAEIKDWLKKIYIYIYILFQIFALFWMLYAFFWVIPRRMNFIYRRFGTQYSIFIGRWVWRMTRSFSNLVILHTSNLVTLHTYLPMWMEQTECSETSAYTIQTPGNYPEESIQHIYFLF